jgi:sortase (surface protein transpeptidase)
MRSKVATVGLLLIGLSLAACSGASEDQAAGAPATAESEAATPAEPHPALETFRARRDHEEVAVPVRVRIPDIGVTSGLEQLVRADDLSIEVPRDPGSVGWYADGPRPGQVGPAVLLGHVDSRSGPAIFYRLDELRPGDAVVVDRSDGTSVEFSVTRTDQLPKDEFPTDLVYLPTLRPELRLVTCGGVFDTGTGHYRDNVIVFASLVA